MTINKSYIEIL